MVSSAHAADHSSSTAKDLLVPALGGSDGQQHASGRGLQCKQGYTAMGYAQKWKVKEAQEVDAVLCAASLGASPGTMPLSSDKLNAWPNFLACLAAEDKQALP